MKKTVVINNLYKKNLYSNNLYRYNIFGNNFVPYIMNNTIISPELGQRGERGEGRSRGFCNMVSVNISINTLAYINANGTQYE